MCCRIPISWISHIALRNVLASQNASFGTRTCQHRTFLDEKKFSREINRQRSILSEFDNTGRRSSLEPRSTILVRGVVIPDFGTRDMSASTDRIEKLSKFYGDPKELLNFLKNIENSVRLEENE